MKQLAKLVHLLIAFRILEVYLWETGTIRLPLQKEIGRMNNQLVAWLTALSAMDKGVIAVWGLMLLAYGINRQHPKWFRGSGLLLVIVTILSLVYFWKTYFV